jgi:6-phosphogluconolactonase
MRTTGLRIGVLSRLARSGGGLGGGRDLIAEPGASLATTPRSRGKQRNSLVTLVYLLILAACGGSTGSQKGCAVVPSTTCTVNCVTIPGSPQFLYATSPNQILAFAINQSTGALSTPQVMAGPNQSNGMVAAPFGQLYVSDFLNDAVDGFTISSSGALSAVPGSPFSLGGAPPGAGGLNIQFQAQTYLYATDLNAGTVAGFLYDGSNGTLTTVPGSPFPAGNTPVQAAQAAGFLYVSDLNHSAGGISAFAINAQNGALTAISGSPFPTGAPGSYPGPSAIVVNADNTFLYVALAGTANANNQIAAFAINQTTGSLTAVPGSPFPTGNDPLQMAYLPIPVGAFDLLYTGNVQDFTISAFTADHTTGVLTPVNGSPYPAGSSVGGLAAVTASTQTAAIFLYQSDPQAQAVRAYSINTSTGALSPVTGSPFPASGYAPTLLTSAVGP